MPLSKTPLSLELALLGFLRDRPRHAYEIYLMLQQAGELGIVWHLKQSHLYALLNRLEEAGYVTALVEPQGSRPPRKSLELTPAGRDAFAAWLTAPVQHARDFRLEFLAKLYFALQEGESVADTLIERQRLACTDWLQDLRSRAADAHMYDRLVYEFRIGQVEAILRWLDTCQSTLTEHAAARR